MVVHDRAAATLGELLGRLRGAQKSNKGAPGYSRWVNRPAGRFLAAVAYKTGLTPNQVTVASAIVTFAGIAILALIGPTPVIGASIAVLLMLGFALDAADGQLARLVGKGRLDGEWLDHVVDCVKCVALHSCVLISWFRFQHVSPSAWLLVPLLYGFQSSVWFFAITLTDQLRGRATGGGYYSRAVVGERAPLLRSILLTPADYGVLCLSFVLLSFQALFAYVYGALMILNLGFLALALPRWYLELRRLSGPPPTESLADMPAVATGGEKL